MWSVQTYNQTVEQFYHDNCKKIIIIIVIKILILELFFSGHLYIINYFLYMYVLVCTLLSKLTLKFNINQITSLYRASTDLSQYLWFKLLKSSSLAIFFRYFVNFNSSLSLCLFLWASLKGLILRQNEIKKVMTYKVTYQTVCNLPSIYIF